MFEELVELCEGLGHKILVREQGENLWHVRRCSREGLGVDEAR